MMFIDGENLAIRYKNAISGDQPLPHVEVLEDVYVWSRVANIPHHTHCEVMRKYYYTAVQGDEDKIRDVERKLKDLGIEAPKVFKKVKGRSSKRVDITLATDMLTHANRGNYDIAILVAGDADYVPLVQAIKGEGRRVVVWFFESGGGLSDKLQMEADYFSDISWFFLKPADKIRVYYPGVGL